MIHDSDIEYTGCPLCGSHDDKVHYNFHPYKVVRCQSCGLYYLSPRLKESVMLKVYQDSAYYKSEGLGYSNYIEQEETRQATFRRLMVNLKKRNLTGGALLEVGCGYGYLLEEARDYFEIRMGTEFSPDAVKEAQKRADHVFEGGIEHVPVSERFDCIIAHEVIEHVYEPVRFLEGLIKHLKPKGRVVIATPNFGSFWRRFMGRHWPLFKAPEHVLFFDSASLHVLMQKAGLIGIRHLPYLHAYPVSLIASKLNMRRPPLFDKIVVWIPWVIVVMYGVMPD